MPRLLLALLLGLSACADKSGDDTAAPSETGDTDTDTGQDTDTAADTSGDTAAADLDGEGLFAEWCSSCHGAAGEGSYSAPALDREVPRKSDEQLISIILNGEDDMSPVPVTAEEAAAIVAYLRTLFPS